ncbi:MAG: hypothetical protein M3Y79_11475 [Pseudomonadota bacterium]|nr:hypothetical protein [Pseudomonadota bacterium]
MSITQQDASAALDAVAHADRRVREFKGSREASPYLILWGAIWLVCNAVTGLAPRFAGRPWEVALVIGALVTVLLVVLRVRRNRQDNIYAASERALIGRRAATIGTAMMMFFPAMFTVLPPLTGMQNNAFISLSWAFVYMVAGAWVGLRLFFTGVATAAAVLVGYLLLREHYFLWMAVVGGGSLMLGGLWLRKL